MTAPTYPLDNDHAHAYAHHRYLAALLDPVTRARVGSAVEDTRPTGLTGARCLEVGAGGGSIARWLADKVGPFGHVMAIDLKPHHIPHQQRITVLTHDLNGDEPLPGGPFDLIHARLVLAHLPKRRDILADLIDRLTYNGVIAIGDWRTTNPDPIVAAPNPGDAELYRRFQHILGTQVFAAAGTDRDWAARTHTELREEGLTDIHTTVHAEYWEGGGTGCRLVATVIEEVRPKLLAAGLTEDDLEALAALVNDPRLVLHGHPLYYTTGRRTPRWVLDAAPVSVDEGGGGAGVGRGRAGSRLSAGVRRLGGSSAGPESFMVSIVDGRWSGDHRSGGTGSLGAVRPS